ncbi:AsmA family protein [Alphaproteobacteria bacterium]|nr:AsmA family protein [Alphaproteobacteria bacterium]
MRKFLFTFGALVLLLAVAVLIAPQFINWNLYKTEITTAVRNVTGRELNIDGDIEVTIIPSLALKVSNVRFASIAGAKSKEMLRLNEVRVGISLGDLISGKLAVILTLIKPVLELEVTRGSQTNWAFTQSTTPLQSDAASSQGGKEELPLESSPLNIQLDSFRVVEGTVTYRDGRTGQFEKIKDFNSEVSFDSLKGPFRLKGDAGVKDFPLRFEIETGMIDLAGMTPVTAKIGAKQGGADFMLTGDLSNLTTAPAFSGKFKAYSDNVATLVARISGQAAPAILRQTMNAVAKVAVSQQSMTLTELAVQFGKVRGIGAASIALTGNLGSRLKLRVSSFDLDGLLQEDSAISSGSTKTGNAKVKVTSKSGKIVTDKASAAVAALPANLDFSVDLGADVVKFRGGVLRQANAKIRLAQGKIFIQQMSVLLPGSGSVGLAGTLQISKGKPFANIRIKAESDDLRGLLRWLKAEPLDISTSRLRRFSVDTVLQGTSENLQARSLSAKLDNTAIQGGLTLVLGGKPAFGLRLVADRINLDAYMPRRGLSKSRQKEKSKTDKITKDAKGESSTPKSALSHQQSTAGFFNTFDANIAATVKNLTFQKQPVRNVKVNLSIVDGALAVKEFSVADFAGVGVTLSGRLNNLDSKSAITVNYNAVVNDSKRLFRFFGKARPATLQKIGKISSTGTLSGDLQKLNVNSTIEVIGGAAKLEGRITSPLINPKFDMGVGLNFLETSTLLKLMNAGYRQAKGKIGRLVVSFHAAGTPQKVVLNTIKGTVGPTTVNGSASADLASIVPNVIARLNFGAVDLAQYKAISGGGGRPDAKRRHGRGQKAGQSRSRARQSRASAGTHRRWSSDRIDLNALKSANANFALSMASLNLDGLVLRNVATEGSLEKGVLKFDTFNALVFGGSVSATATVDASSDEPALVAGLNIEKAAVDQAVVALKRLRINFGPFKFGGSIKGPVSIRNLAITATGRTEAALVSSLAGKGRLEGTLNFSLASGTKVGAAVAGIAGLASGIAGGLLGKKSSSLQPLTQAAQTSNRLIGYFSRAPNKVLGDFAINRGVVKSSNLQIVGQNAVALTAGAVDLPRWRLNTNSQITENGQGGAPLVTAAASGDIGRPNIKVGGSWLQVRVPQKRAAPTQKAPGNLPKFPQQRAQPQQKKEPKRIQPQDILKGIFGR